MTTTTDIVIVIATVVTILTLPLTIDIILKIARDRIK